MFQEEHSDQGHHCLPIMSLSFYTFLNSLTNLFTFKGDSGKTKSRLKVNP